MESKSALCERLEAAVLERHCANHPLTEKWAAGKLSRNAMAGWAIEQYQSQPSPTSHSIADQAPHSALHRCFTIPEPSVPG